MPCVVSPMAQFERGLGITNGPVQSAVDTAAAKKRKRTRKVYADKKFVCSHESCGKSYSRAEHLYRHQLNHTPKQIYRCDFPDCCRSFVRQDLCIRHRERHTTSGSQLQKRDHFAQAASRIHGKRLLPSNATSDLPSSTLPSSSNILPAPSGVEPIASPSISEASQPIPSASSPESASVPAYHYPPLVSQSGLSEYTFSQSNGHQAVASPAAYASYAPLSGRSSPHTPVSTEPGPEPQSFTTTAMSPNISAPYPISTDMNTAMIQSTTYDTQPGLTIPVTGYDLSLSTPAPATTLGGLEPGMVASGTTVNDTAFGGMSPYPMFGGETYNRSPFAMADDFAAWLFNDSGAAPASPASMAGYPQTAGMMPSYMDTAPIPDPFLGEQAYNGLFGNVIPQHPMSVTSILDHTPQATMSEEKRRELLHLMSSRFNEAAYSAEAKHKDSLMDGNLDDDYHVLSLHMMQTYIGSYWYHFHNQLPIMHQPTFVVDKAPNLLLLAMMAIGASTLDRMHGSDATESAAELANFIGWHLRWELFMDADFRPPAKPWIFQALLLLEVYEKRYSTRALHERAHIHHDTTLTLMRRGSSLIGRDFSGNFRDDRPGHSHSGSVSESAAAEESWSNWIKAEGTRRVAFAAFLVDSTHATMFGHSVKMVAHELRLPLPCDEALWSATSAAEVARMQSNLRDNGVKPIMFLDGLKKTLNGEPVRTNAFGRTILMSGLLSVSWHMNQRDLQVSSLGVPQALGGRDKWRSSLIRAFDNWRQDGDSSQSQLGFGQGSTSEDPEVWHGLAHMASHVDIVDCQIFAGASRLMGRSITPRDSSAAREKMTNWASKASARDATFYALKVLSKSLVDTPDHWSGSDATYSARDDAFLNRPWALYMAALVVWSYGYALDGAVKLSVPLDTKAQQQADMRVFLSRVGSAREPNELGAMPGRNQCAGMLMILRDSFLDSRWELMGEAGALLGSCLEKLLA